MAELGQAQRVHYGDLEAVYNDLPFTLTHWKRSSARQSDGDGNTTGHQRTYELTGYITAADAESLATTYAAALAVLGVDGGDFRVQIPKAGDPPAWHALEELHSSETAEGIHVEQYDVSPAGGCQLNVSVTLSAVIPGPAARKKRNLSRATW